MDMQQLDYFIECSALGSIRKVAQFRYCSVSSISRKIALLEHELDTELFYKDATGLTLTEEGELFLAWALHNREEYRQILRQIAPISGKNDNTVRIGCYFFDGTYTKLSKLKEFLPLKAGETSYEIHFIPLGSMVPRVNSGELDFGINAQIVLLNYGFDIESLHFNDSQYKLTVGWHHPLFGRKSITAEEVINNYTTDEFFLPGEMKKYAGAPIRSLADLKQIAHDYIRAYMHLPGMNSEYFQNLAQNAMFYQKVILGNQMAITVEDLSVSSNKYLSSIPFKNPEMSGDIRLFWKRGNQKIGVQHLIESVEQKTGSITYDSYK